MNCKDVKKKIRRDVVISSEIMEHFKSCPSCAQMAQSSLLLQDILKSHNETYPVTPIEELITKIEKLALPKETFMSKVKEQIDNRPKLIYGMGFAIFLFLFITLVPFSYKINAGYDLIVGNDQQIEISREQIDLIIFKIGLNDIGIEHSGNQLIFTGLSEKQDAIKIATALDIILQNKFEYKINPVYNTISGSLYAQVKDKIKVNVESEGKTLEQMAQEIEEQLSKFYSAVNAIVVEEDGNRRIQVRVSKEEDGKKNEQLFELYIEAEPDEDITFEISTLAKANKLDIDMEGKSDDEIISEVKAKLEEQGQPDADVTITTNQDGKREINIKVDRDEMIEK
ncbi:MAG: hypothetical protein ABIJ45_06805 [Candidatus Zixiibacteriota bacterium]